MMFDLKDPLKQGDTVPVTLKFEKAGEVKCFARGAGRWRTGARRRRAWRSHDEEEVRQEMHSAGRPSFIAIIATAVVAMSSASAHITLLNREAAIGSSYKAVFVVSHGCAGSATTEIRVQIPKA